MTRRKVLVVGGATAAAVGVAGALTVNASADEATPVAADATGTAGDVCYTLTSELVEGPYYIDADKIRQDITEDQAGIPLTLKLKVIDSETCKPLRNAAVDIWHCNATGVYSGYSSGGGSFPTGSPTDIPTGTPTGIPTGTPPGGGGGGHQEPTNEDRYLRGTWHTDRHGHVTFRTVFPGWYQGRCVHIHVKVHVDGEWTDAGYEGGHTCHTGQLFFDESAVLLTEPVDPYSTNTTTRVTLDQDGIYPDNGHEGGLLYLHYDKKHIERGVHARLTLGVDPSATNDGQDGGGPGGQPPTTTASPSASAS